MFFEWMNEVKESKVVPHHKEVFFFLTSLLEYSCFTMVC